MTLSEKITHYFFKSGRTIAVTGDGHFFRLSLAASLHSNGAHDELLISLSLSCNCVLSGYRRVSTLKWRRSKATT